MPDRTIPQSATPAQTRPVTLNYHPRLTLPAEVRRAKYPCEAVLPKQRVDLDEGLCLTAGTRLITNAGRLPVEKFALGTRVWTLENGFQPLVRIRRCVVRLTPCHFAQRPVVLRRDALGSGAPMRDIRLAPQQSLMVDDWGNDPNIRGQDQEVSAGELIERDRAERDLKCKSVTYFCLGFESPQIVEAEGLLSRAA